MSPINEQSHITKTSESTKSVATSVSELDTLSEHSVDDESAQWTSPHHGTGSRGDGNRDDAGCKRYVFTEEGLPSIAEAGNRLSQLELREASTNTALSIVDIAYDL